MGTRYVLVALDEHDRPHADVASLVRDGVVRHSSLFVDDVHAAEVTDLLIEPCALLGPAAPRLLLARLR